MSCQNVSNGRFFSENLKMWSYLSLFFLHLCMRKICILLYQKHILFEITHFTQCNAQKYIFFNQNIPWTPKTKFLMEAWHGCFFGGKATCLGKKCQAKCNISKKKPKDKKSVVKLWPVFFSKKSSKFLSKLFTGSK